MHTPALTDSFGRRIEYLRLSITDRCDFRCVYCMPEKMRFLPRSEVMDDSETIQIARTFARLGTRKIRISGGEPLVRPGVVGLCERIRLIPGINELCMTTNGSRLDVMARGLHDSGVDRLNVSLDSLHADRFAELTRHGELSQTLRGIERAQAVGFQRTKINCVVLKGRNDDEVCDLVQFAIDHDLDISFIEEMPLGDVAEHDRRHTFCSSSEIRQALSDRYSLVATHDSTGGPARYWRISGASKTRIGFISPHSENFCSTCNRVRVTAEGRLLLCLGNEHAVDLKSVLRQWPKDPSRLEETIVNAMNMKPRRHTFSLEAEVQIVRFMNLTGG